MTPWPDRSGTAATAWIPVSRATSSVSGNRALRSSASSSTTDSPERMASATGTASSPAMSRYRSTTVSGNPTERTILNFPGVRARTRSPLSAPRAATPSSTITAATASGVTASERPAVMACSRVVRFVALSACLRASRSAAWSWAFSMASPARAASSCATTRSSLPYRQSDSAFTKVMAPSDRSRTWIGTLMKDRIPSFRSSSRCRSSTAAASSDSGGTSSFSSGSPVRMTWGTPLGSSGSGG